MSNYIYTIKGCQVDEEDIKYLSKFNWKFNTNAYPFFWKKRRDGSVYKYYMHWMVLHLHGVKTWNGMEVDHIDRNRQNNRFNNLRIVTHAENQMNKNKLLLTEEERDKDRMIMLMRKDGKTEEEINQVFNH